MDHRDSNLKTDIQRRKFMEWIGLSSLSLALPMLSLSACGTKPEEIAANLEFKNVFDLEDLSRKVMGEDAIEYLNGGADDLKTVKANLAGYDKIQIRARRLIDVSTISIKVELFGQTLETPLISSPVGFQKFFHPEREVGTAKAAAS
jgi:4-hydroxymandelate oxidase